MPNPSRHLNIRSISISEFKATCLDVIRTVQEQETPYTITRHGKPVAELRPLPASEKDPGNPLKNSILAEQDLITPIDEAWDDAAS